MEADLVIETNPKVRTKKRVEERERKRISDKYIDVKRWKKLLIENNINTLN